MNANKMLLVVATTLLTACSGQKEATGPQATASPPPGAKFCRENVTPTPLACQPAAGKVNVWLDRYDVQPPNVCADPGEKLTLKIHSTVSSTFSVVVLPKDAGSNVPWLFRFNDDNEKIDEIIIEIPPDKALSGQDFNYRVANLSEGGCVDPIIHIN